MVPGEDTTERKDTTMHHHDRREVYKLNERWVAISPPSHIYSNGKMKFGPCWLPFRGASVIVRTKNTRIFQTAEPTSACPLPIQDSTIMRPFLKVSLSVQAIKCLLYHAAFGMHIVWCMRHILILSTSDTSLFHTHDTCVLLSWYPNRVSFQHNFHP